MAEMPLCIQREVEIEILRDGDATVDARWFFLGDNVRLLLRAYAEAVHRFSANTSHGTLETSLRASAEIGQFYRVRRNEERVCILMRDSVFREAGPKLVDFLELRVRRPGAVLSQPLPLECLKALGRLLPALLQGGLQRDIEAALSDSLDSCRFQWAMALLCRLKTDGFLSEEARQSNSFSSGSRPRLSFLGHTGLLFESRQGGVVIDPLLWRRTGLSANAFDAARTRLSAISCTHAHWDHFFPSALLWFDKDLPIIVPKVRKPTAFNPPMINVLRLLGFTDIREAKHWQPIHLDDMEFIPIPFHGEQDEPDAEIDHYTYVIRSDSFCVYGGVDSFEDSFGSMRPVLERVRDEYGPQIAALPASQMIYWYKWGGVNGFCRYLDSDLLEKSFQYTAGPMQGAEWTRLLGVRYVIPYALFVMRRWQAHPQVTQFKNQLRKIGHDNKLYPLRPMDAIALDDLRNSKRLLCKRKIILVWHSIADTGRIIDKLSERWFLYRGVRWAIRHLLRLDTGKLH